MKPGDLVRYHPLLSTAGFGDEWTIIRSKGYRGLGSRYLHRSTDEEREKEMSFLNRHFDDDGKVTRYYDSEDLKSYPGWDDW